MKHLLATLFAAVAFARGDLVVEQRMESSFVTGRVVMKIKGDQARVDMPSEMTILIDSKAAVVTTLLHAQKKAVKLDLAEAKKQAETAQKLNGIDTGKIEKPKATGQKEKVGDWDAEIHEFEVGSETKGKLWLVKDFPNYKVLSEQINKISSAMVGTGFDPSKFDLEGMIVKIEINSKTGKMTKTLLSIKEEVVADTEFKIPEGFQESKLGGK